MSELPESVYRRIMTLCERGDQLFERDEPAAAIQEYRRAWDLLPPPREDWDAATHILTALAEAHFHSGEFKLALSALDAAVACPGGLGNPFVHPRLGQCHLELGNEARAADELARAYMGAGAEIFDAEDPKYFAFVKRLLREPVGGW